MRKISFFIQIFIIFSSTVLAQDIASGVKLIQNEKYDEAIKTFRYLLNGSSKAEADFYLGEVYFIEGKIDSAKQFYEDGIASDNEFPLNYAGLVKIYLSTKNSPDAEKNFNQAMDLGKDNPEVYVVLAEAYASDYGGKDYNKAIDLLQKALQVNPKYANAYIALGDVYLKMSDGTKAITNYQTAFNINKSDPEPLTRIGKVYILVNNYTEATRVLNEAIKIDSSYSPIYKELTDLNVTLNNYPNAVGFYKQYIEFSAITPENQKRYASLLYMNKDYDKTINILKDVLSRDSADASSSIRILAYSYLRTNDIENSKYYFQKLFEIPSVDFLPTDYENYATLLSKTGNDSLAIIYLYKIVDLDSTRKDILGQISILSFKSRNWSGVIAALERKGELTSQEYFDLGKAYYFIQNYPKADSTFNILTKKMPDLAIAYFWQARVKTNFDPESDSGLAKPYYEQFITISKEDTTKFKNELLEAYSYLGYYYYIKKDNAQSKVYWQKVEAIDPNNPQANAALKVLK